MSSDDRQIAARYVEALFALAAEGKHHDTVKADMLAFKATLAQSDALQKFLASPVTGQEVSAQLIGTVMDSIKASDLTRKFFTLLTHNRRLAIIPLAIDVYLARLAESRGELTAHVTSAQPLGKDEIKALGDVIAKSTGKKVEIKTQENPALLGGLQIRVGSRLLDNSVAGKLARLKQALTKAA